MTFLMTRKHAIGGTSWFRASNRVLAALLASSVAGLEGGGAWAQAAESSDTGDIEEIIVTGSRIPRRRDFTAPSPVTTLGHEAIEFSASSNLEDLLNTIPQVAPDYGRTSNNPGNGPMRLF